MSNIGDTLLNIGKTVVGGVISSNPIGAGIIGIINGFLGDDDKIPTNATADEVNKKFEGLSSEDKAKVMTSYHDLLEKQIDLQITNVKEDTKRDLETTKRFEAMEITNRSSKVRPYLVVLFSIFLIVILSAIGGAVAYRWIEHGELPGKDTSWEFFLILLYIPARVVFKYFDIRTDEKKSMLAGVTGGKINMGGSLSDIFIEREKTKQTQLNKLK